jgi:hypothetical protein
MAITSANHNAIPVQYYASGSFFDNGTVKKSVIKLGFKPRYFKLVNETDRTVYEVFDGQAANNSLKAVAAGTLTLETADSPTIVEDLNLGTVNTWTVYETAKGVVGTVSVGLPLVAAAEATDNSRLNAAGELATGVTISAAIAITSKQFRWIAWA